MGSADLQDSSGFYDGRLTLPLGKFGGLFPVCIHAGKPFSVLVKHGHLPMLVFAPPIFSELYVFFRFWFWALFEYLNEDS